MQHLIKKSIYIFTAFLFSYSPFSFSKEFEDRIVALVNDSPITAYQVEAQTQLLLHQSQMPNLSHEEMKKNVLQQMINQQLQVQIATAKGLEIDSKQLEEAIHKIAEKENLSVPELEAQIKESGLSVQDFKKQLESELLVNQLQEKEIAAHIQITQEDIQQYSPTKPDQKIDKKSEIYQYNVVDYFSALSEKASAKTKDHTKNIVSEFYQHLLSHPQKIRVPKGIVKRDLGWNKLNQLPDSFATALAAMKPGEFHLPILAENGFHILELVNKKIVSENEEQIVEDEDEDENDINDDKNPDSIKEIIFRQKFEQNLEKWLKEQREKAYIKIYS